MGLGFNCRMRAKKTIFTPPANCPKETSISGDHTIVFTQDNYYAVNPNDLFVWEIRDVLSESPLTIKVDKGWYTPGVDCYFDEGRRRRGVYHAAGNEAVTGEYNMLSFRSWDSNYVMEALISKLGMTGHWKAGWNMDFIEPTFYGVDFYKALYCYSGQNVKLADVDTGKFVKEYSVSWDYISSILPVGNFTLLRVGSEILLYRKSTQDLISLGNIDIRGIYCIDGNTLWLAVYTNGVTDIVLLDLTKASVTTPSGLTINIIFIQDTTITQNLDYVDFSYEWDATYNYTPDKTPTVELSCK